jgi:hypothetical protein
MELLPKLEAASGCEASVFASFIRAMHVETRTNGTHWLGTLKELRSGKSKQAPPPAGIEAGMLQSLDRHCDELQVSPPLFSGHADAAVITGLCEHVYREHYRAEQRRSKKKKRSGSKGAKRRRTACPAPAVPTQQRASEPATAVREGPCDSPLERSLQDLQRPQQQHKEHPALAKLNTALAALREQRDKHPALVRLDTKPPRGCVVDGEHVLALAARNKYMSSSRVPWDNTRVGALRQVRKFCDNYGPSCVIVLREPWQDCDPGYSKYVDELVAGGHAYLVTGSTRGPADDWVILA